jgi:hypothetical protein
MASFLIDPYKNLTKGYPALSGEMGLLPQIAIFRRFGALGARNLLYLQAELIMLEQELCKAEQADSLSTEGKKNCFCRDWFWLSHAGPNQPATPCEQWQLVLRIRGVLKEFSMRSIVVVGER